MGGNRAILIWIGILTLAGIILLMVACETGILLPRDNKQLNEQAPEETQTVAAEQTQAEPEQTDTPLPDPREETIKTLTSGRPYSQKLTEDGSRNILILGQDKVSNLYDTIGIASIDKNGKKVSLIMIPRDTYIEYNSDIRAKLEASNLLHEPGVYRINYTHHIGSLIDYSGRFSSGSISFLADVIEEKFRIKIDDYMKINTKGFREMVDHLGGIEIYVPYDMNYDDPVQDLHIHIPKGTQYLDGVNAEGFVRFRQGYREDGSLFEIGDVNRKKNQLNFLQQLIKQKGTVGNIGKIPGIISILGKNVQHSIGFGDVLQTYIGLATDIVKDGYEISSVNINSDKMTRIDGASYLVLE